MAVKKTPDYKPILLAVGVLAIVAAGIILFAQRNSEMLTTEGKYQVTATDIFYYDNSKGFFAEPAIEGDYPGVVMIHEWWGLNDNIKDMARQLASEGYSVLAVDLYNGEVAATPERARNLTQSLNRDEAIANMKAAFEYLRQNDADKIASLGWCFGGGQSLQLSLNENVDATVIYYGTLVTNDTQLASLDAPVLGIFGDQDTSIPVSTVNTFDQKLDQMGVENEIYIYPGVGHAFANPSGMNYAPQETIDAWSKTVGFLDRHLKA